MNSSFIRLKIKIIGPHTPDLISFQTHTRVVGHLEDLQLLISTMTWINQIQINELNVHIVKMTHGKLSLSLVVFPKSTFTFSYKMNFTF